MDAASYFLINGGGAISLAAALFFALGVGLGWSLWGRIRPRLQETQRKLRLAQARVEASTKEARQLRSEREAKQDSLSRASEARERERLRADSAEKGQAKTAEQHARLQADAQQLQAQKQALEDQQQALQSRVDAYKKANSELKARLEQAAESEQRLSRAETAAAELQAELAARDRRLDALGARAAALEQAASEARRGPRAKRCAEPAGMRQDPRLGPVYDEAPAEADDLTQIKGVGDVLQAKLNQHGIYRFAQIAAWGPDQGEAFSELLQFKGHIQREHWAEQAKALAAGSGGD